jgi:hypothetical protein
VTEERRRAAVVCGLLAAMWAFLVPIVGARGVDGYSQTSQYISELGARGMPHGVVISTLGFGVTGLLVFVFLWLARPGLPATGLATAGVVAFAGVGVAYLAASVFRCDPGCPSEGSLSQTIHSTSGLFEYVGGGVGLLLLAAALRHDSPWRGAAAVTAAAAILVGIGFLGMLRPDRPEWRGFNQRIADGAIFAWIAWTSIALDRGGRVIGRAARVVRDA